MLRLWLRFNESCFPLQPLAESMPVRTCVKRKESSHILPIWNGVRGNLDFDDTTRCRIEREYSLSVLYLALTQEKNCNCYNAGCSVYLRQVYLLLVPLCFLLILDVLSNRFCERLSRRGKFPRVTRHFWCRDTQICASTLKRASKAIRIFLYAILAHEMLPLWQ